jgi:serine/threonine protein kinase
VRELRPFWPRLICRTGVGGAVAAAVMTLPPARPLEVDPFILLLLATASGLAAPAVLGYEPFRYSVLVGLLLVAALAGAALREFQHASLHRTLFLAFAGLATAALAPGLRRRPAFRPPPPRDLGATVGGRWRLDEPLPNADRGGFSEPWLGEDLNQPDRQVVVKLQSQSPQRSTESGNRLLREQRVLGAVQSRYVVGLRDAGWDSNLQRRYVVLDYYPTGSLARYLDRTVELRLGWVLRLLTRVTEALVVLHEELPHPLVHRDLTPRNILLRQDQGTPVLADFGSALSLRRRGIGFGDRITAGVVYSSFYAPPELVDLDLHNRWDPTPASDLFGACAILYECITGRPPYWREARESGLEYGSLVLNPELRPLPPTWAYPGLPPALDDLMRRGLADRPDARPPTARAMLEELHRIACSVDDLRIPFAELRATRISTAISATVTLPDR